MQILQSRKKRGKICNSVFMPITQIRKLTPSRIKWNTSFSSKNEKNENVTERKFWVAVVALLVKMPLCRQMCTFDENKIIGNKEQLRFIAWFVNLELGLEPAAHFNQVARPFRQTKRDALFSAFLPFNLYCESNYSFLLGSEMLKNISFGQIWWFFHPPKSIEIKNSPFSSLPSSPSLSLSPPPYCLSPPSLAHSPLSLSPECLGSALRLS